MATVEERMGVLEGRFETLMETLATQLGPMNARISDVQRTLRAWLLALTGLSAAQLAATVAIALTLARR
jgi:hypothetical protein